MYLSEIGITTSNACTCLACSTCITSVGGTSRNRVLFFSNSYSRAMIDVTVWLIAPPITPMVLPLRSSMLVAVPPGGTMISTTECATIMTAARRRQIADVRPHHRELGLAFGKGFGGFRRGRLFDHLEPHLGVDGVELARDRRHQFGRVAVERTGRDRERHGLRGIAIGVNARAAGQRQEAQHHRHPHPTRRTAGREPGEDREHARARSNASRDVLGAIRGFRHAGSPLADSAPRAAMASLARRGSEGHVGRRALPIEFWLLMAGTVIH